MDPKPPADRYQMAPRASGGAAMRLPGSAEPLSVEEHIVAPETREEMVRGRRISAAPAKEPHGDRHSHLDYVIRGSVAPGYVSSTDLLTRVSEGSDFATDTCVRKEGIDPSTGKRWLEELAFEVVSEQSISDVTERAQELSAAGVRRLLAIFVKKGEVCEWSDEHLRWERLDPEQMLVDPALARPLRVSALLDASEADDAVVRALEIKGNAAIAQIEDASRRRGLRSGIEALCEVLEIPLGSSEQATLERLDVAGLEALMERLKVERRWG